MLATVRERDSRNSSSGSNPTNRGEKKQAGEHQISSRSLPTAGYLFKERVDISNIIDPLDMGLTVLQARRKGGLEVFYSPAKYTGQIQNIRDQMTKKRLGRTVTDLQTWGDGINVSSTWPKVDPEGHLRIMFYNVHGISYKNNYFEMDMLMQLGGQVQADVMLITEINLNLHQPKVRAKLKDSIRAYDKYAKVQMAYPPDSPFSTSEFNMGGNMAIVQGGLSGRCGDQGADLYGRWSWVTIRGEVNKLVIMSGYKVGKNSGLPGGTSVAQQEVRAMLRRKHRLATKPREAFDADLIDFCTKQQNLGHDILLMMDANTPLDSAETQAFSKAANLHSVAEFRFPHESLPRTHQLGSRCIDYCLVTKKLLKWTLKFGYFPFFIHSLFDHRGMVLDLRCSEFFGKFKVDETRKVTRKLRASHPKDADAYRSHLKRMLTAAGIFNKVTELCNGFHELS